MQKKILSVILALVMLLTVFAPAAYAEKDGLKLMVSTDTHFQPASVTGDIPEDVNDPLTRGMKNREVFYYVSQQGQLNYESTALMQKLLDDFCASDAEYLLIGGDLTNGKRESHLAMAQMLKATEEKSGKEIFVTVGNHDCAKTSSETAIDIHEFKEIYADFGFAQALCLDPASASYTYDLSDEYRLLAIDSCVYGEDDGDIDSGVAAFVKAQAETAEAEGKKLIGMMHHSILPHFEVQPMISGYMKQAEDFADMGIHFVFTGHIHANDISMAQTKKGNILYDIQTGSLITSPNAYREVTFTGDTANIRSVSISQIDTSLLPAGYSEEQLSMIENDFAEYSRQFFKAGMCRYINRYIGSADKLGKTLKLKTDGAAYALLNKLMLKIGDALLLPIYDDGTTPDVPDSIEEIAKSVCGSVPESDYEQIYEVVATVMNGFYTGDEKADIREVEVPLLLDCVKVCLAHCIANMIYAGEPMEHFNDLLSSVGVNPKMGLIKGLTGMNYAIAASNKLVTALIEPLLNGLACDFSAPEDINVTLNAGIEPSGNDTLAPLSWFKRIVMYFKNVADALFRLLNFRKIR